MRDVTSIVCTYQFLLGERFLGTVIFLPVGSQNGASTSGCVCIINPISYKSQSWSLNVSFETI